MADQSGCPELHGPSRDVPQHRLRYRQHDTWNEQRQKQAREDHGPSGDCAAESKRGKQADQSGDDPYPHPQLDAVRKCVERSGIRERLEVPAQREACPGQRDPDRIVEGQDDERQHGRIKECKHHDGNGRDGDAPDALPAHRHSALHKYSGNRHAARDEPHDDPGDTSQNYRERCSPGPVIGYAELIGD